MVDSELTSDEVGGRLGMVVSGSLTEGVQVKLDPDSSVEAVKVGTFVTLQGERMRFFGVVTDVSLGSTDATLSASPPDVSDPYVAQVISGTAAYGALTVEPMLTIAGDDPEVLLEGPQPAKTVPPHFRGGRGSHGAGHRARLRGRRRRPLLDRQPAGHGHEAVPGRAGAGDAQQRRVRQERHRQDVPDPAAAGGHRPER